MERPINGTCPVELGMAKIIREHLTPDQWERFKALCAAKEVPLTKPA